MHVDVLIAIGLFLAGALLLVGVLLHPRGRSK